MNWTSRFIDAHQQLAFESDVSFTCLGMGGEFVLIDNSDSEDSARLTTLARDNGWAYCGILGLKDGIPLAESEADSDSRLTMLYAGLAFCRIVSDRLRHPEKGDSVSWLRSLHALSDTRGCVNA